MFAFLPGIPWSPISPFSPFSPDVPGIPGSPEGHVVQPLLMPSYPPGPGGP